MDQIWVQNASGHLGSTKRLTLTILKTVHTLIWVIMATANFGGFYLAFVGTFNTWFFLCLFLLGGEIVIIVVNGWHRPLTDVIARYTSNRAANFDIYLPEWLGTEQHQDLRRTHCSRDHNCADPSIRTAVELVTRRGW
jgi:hypothetical protein